MVIDWVNGVFIPLVESIFILAFLIGLVVGLGFILERAIIKHFQFWFKYTIMRKPYNEDDIKCLISMEGLNVEKIRMKMLLDGCSTHKINEIIYLYRKTKVK